MRNTRQFKSAPTLDAERKSLFGPARNWNPGHIEIFGHNIDIDLPTGNLIISTNDIAYPYYNFSLGIIRKYDIQEQHMQLSYLRNYPNVNPKQHWFGNWKFGFEADVDETWQKTYPMLHVISGIGANGLFEVCKSDFKWNFKSGIQADEILRTYGIPGRTLTALDWNFAENDFILRTKRGAFQVLAGRFNQETLVDNINAQMWLFNPLSGSGFKITSDYFFSETTSDKRDVGFPLVVTKLIDALGHSIELKPESNCSPYLTYILSDLSGRQFRLEMGRENAYLDGLNPGGLVRKRVLSKVIDGTKGNYNEYYYNYNSNNLLKNVIFPSTIGNRQIKYHYNNGQYPGVINAIENSLGEFIKFEYEEDPTDNDERLNPRLKIKKIIDPEGNEFLYDYDHLSSKIEVTISKNGQIDRQIKYSYIRDTFNTKQRYITNTEIEVAKGYYISSDGQVTPRDSRTKQIIRNRTLYTNDGRYNIKKEIDPLNREVSYIYNDFNQVKQKWNFDNHWTKYEYDNPTEYGTHTIFSPNLPYRFDLLKVIKQNIKRTVDPTDSSQFVEEEIETTILYEWDKYNLDNSNDPKDVKQSTHRLCKETEERGKTWTQFYSDATNHNPLNPTRILSPLSFGTTIAYNNRGERIIVEDAKAHIYKYKYNEQGQLIEYVDPNNESIKLTYYDCHAWLKEYKGQLNKVTQFVRDIDGKIRQIIDPVLNIVDYIYLKNGRLNKIIKHRPEVHEDQTDSNSPSIIQAYANLESEIQYTPLGDVCYLKNPKGLELIFEYDEAGRRFKRYHLSGSNQCTKFVFNSAGQIINRVGRNNEIIHYKYYDNSGFLKSVQFPSWFNGVDNVSGKYVNYKKYDYLGKIFTIDDSELSDTKEFIYDEKGNVVFRRGHDDFELCFDYDDDNRLWHIKDQTGKFELTMALDALGRTKRVTDSDAYDGSLSWKYIYEKVISGNTQVLNLFGVNQADIGLMVNFEYDAKNRLKHTQSRWGGAAGAIYSQGLEYRDDDLINIISGNDANSFLYDGIKQIIYEETENMNSDYDMVGNRKYREDKRSVSVPSENVYNELNRLKEDKKFPTTFDYDDNGNLINENNGDRLFYFDGSGRLRRVLKNSGYQIDYVYDEEGKLVKRKVRDLSSGVVEYTEFSYLLGKPVLIKRNGNLFMLVTWDPDGKLLRIRKPNSVFAGIRNKSLFPVYDGLGDIVRLLDSDKNKRSEVRFDAWGNIVKLIDPDNHLEFFGSREGLRDKHSGLCNYGARWYYPLIGRWISEDPISVSNSSLSGIGELKNLYRYCKNAPINFKDITGLSPEINWNWGKTYHNENEKRTYWMFKYYLKEADGLWAKFINMENSGKQCSTEYANLYFEAHDNYEMANYYFNEWMKHASYTPSMEIDGPDYIVGSYVAAIALSVGTIALWPTELVFASSSSGILSTWGSLMTHIESKYGEFLKDPYPVR